MSALHIEGRRWFQRTYGNTYHTATIYKDGVCVYKSPKQYGYGEQFLQTAWEWLGRNGYPDCAEPGTNGFRWKNYGTQYLRETLGGSYSVIDVARERDL